MKPLLLKPEQVATIIAALRVAAEVYLSDAATAQDKAHGRIALQFYRQRAQAIALFEQLEAEGDDI
jgi:hypothetical protein